MNNNANEIEDEGHKWKMIPWLIYENFSCIYDCFLTLYTFVIKPFLPIGVIEDDEDLKKLNYTSDFLLKNPDKKHRTNFWKYIDGKGYDKIDDKISAFSILSCISGILEFLIQMKNSVLIFQKIKIVHYVDIHLPKRMLIKIINSYIKRRHKIANYGKYYFI